MTDGRANDSLPEKRLRSTPEDIADPSFDLQDLEYVSSFGLRGLKSAHLTMAGFVNFLYIG